MSGFDFPETNFASLVSVLSLPTNRPTDEVYPPAKVAGRKPAESLAGLGTNKRRAICQNFQTEIRRRKTLLLLLAETGGRHQHSAFHDYMLRTKHCKMMAIAEENRFAYKWYSITCQCIIFGRFAGVAAVVGINKGSSNHGDWSTGIAPKGPLCHINSPVNHG